MYSNLLTHLVPAQWRNSGLSMTPLKEVPRTTPPSRSGVTYVEQRRTILVLDIAVQLMESKINFMIQIGSASSPDIPLIYISL